MMLIQYFFAIILGANRTRDGLVGVRVRAAVDSHAVVCSTEAYCFFVETRETADTNFVITIVTSIVSGHQSSNNSNNYLFY